MTEKYYRDQSYYLSPSSLLGISGAVNYGASVALALDELRRVNDGKENGIHFSDGATTYKL